MLITAINSCNDNSKFNNAAFGMGVRLHIQVLNILILIWICLGLYRLDISRNLHDHFLLETEIQHSILFSRYLCYGWLLLELDFTSIV
jgi:hypothetical protein